MKNRLSSLVFGLVAAFALPTQAMYLSPQGTGQVLLFPYFTVNSNQMTLLTVVNTTNAAKMFQINFREGYNSRTVLDFRLFLGPNDSWTSTLFALQQSDGASIMTRDESCTIPDKPGWAAPFPGGGYQQPFLPFAYTGSNEDSGPTSAARMREGHIEIIELAELAGPLAAALTRRFPPNCTPLQLIDPSSPHLLPPGGGVHANFAIVDVAEGTLFGGSATAIDDFSRYPLVNDTASLIEWLGAGNSRPGEVDAQIPVDGGYSTQTYSNFGSPHDGANAVSALIMADSVFGSMSREAGTGSHTEWVLTSPTKYFYTDNQRLGVPLGAPGAVAPFQKTFGEGGLAASCVGFVPHGFDREGRLLQFARDSAGAPGGLPQHALCYATSVVHFSPLPADGATPVLGSRLGSKVWNPTPATETASVRMQLGAEPRTTARTVLPAGLRGAALRGLPVIGFEAVRYINGNVSPGMLANYTMTTPLRADVTCVNAAGAPIECP